VAAYKLATYKLTTHTIYTSLNNYLIVIKTSSWIFL